LINVTARQLPLIIPVGPAYDEANFLEDASNEAARTWLGRTEIWPDSRLALWGDADRGKTHLLRIWAALTGAAVLDGKLLSGFPGMPSPAGAAVNDADRADEAALLHLLNTAHDLGQPVLLAGRAPPARWSVTLPDLDSRLRAITAVEVEAPDDDLLRRLLLLWLAERRLVADEALHDRLLTQLPRDPGVLRAAVALLDREALTSRKRTVTVTMIRDALAAVTATGAGSSSTSG
jgi:chromosomal replication initiation ATPase DnaA